MNKFFGAALVAATLIASGVSAQDRQLKGGDITAVLSGNTGTAGGQMVEYHAPDGLAIIRSRTDGKTNISVGNWKVKRDKVCYKYLNKPDEEHCWRVFQMADGAVMLWGTKEQLIVELKMTKGDTARLERKVEAPVRAQALSIR